MILPHTDADRTALVDGASGRRLTHGTLRAEVEAAASRLRSDAKQLVFVAAGQTLEAVLAYLAVLEAGHAAAWIDPALPDADLARLVEAYRPERVLLGTGARPPAPGYRTVPRGAGGVSWERDAPIEAPPVHPDLGLLLSTSGSTGSRKLVRLARGAVRSNTAAVVQALGLSPADRALAALPLWHAYGLSVLHAHLTAGGSAVLTTHGVLERGYWRLVREERVAWLAGVPFTYELLRRLGPEAVVPDSVTAMTQAGGRLAPEDVRFFRDFMAARGGRFRVMYGQTEATARIAAWPREVTEDTVASVGRVVPGGHVRADAATGVLFYRGPGVMMGYAGGRDDLARPSEVDELDTGDLGRVDADGFVFLSGRVKRIAKVAGVRVALDEVEALAGGRGVAAVESDGGLTVFVEDAGAVDAVLERLDRALRVPRGALRVRHLPALPRSAAGKVDYPALAARAGGVRGQT